MKSTRINSFLNIFTLFTLLALTFSSIGVTPVYAATFIVTNDLDSGAGSLRQAIADAPSGSTITFASGLSAAQIYLASTLTLSNNVTIDGSALAAKITLSGDTDNNGVGDVGVLYVHPGVTATVNSLNITKGYTNAFGGGIRNYGTLTVTNSTLSGNSGFYGGGISNNFALTLTNSTLSGNSGTYGGGIYNNGALTITHSALSSNSAANTGGGIYAIDSSPFTMAIINSTLLSNVSAGSGGGIWSAETLTITNSTLSGNSADAGSGGGISSFYTLTINNSTLSGNFASSNGGGIYNAHALTVTNSTLAGNSAAGAGGGMYTTNSSSPMLKNTLIADSPSGGDCANDGTSALNAASPNNLIEDSLNACGLANSVNGNIIGQDPVLGALANNGGFTQTHALLAGSPAIDAGTNTGCPATDQRGFARVVGVRCDIGAYEFVFPIYKSQGTYDGWILESTEASNIGGSLNSGATTFILGDGAADKQYRAILSFNTSGLPDNAVLTKVTLKIKRPATGFLVGNNNPFTWGLSLKADVCKNFFGTTSALQLSDFNYNNVTNCKPLAGTFGKTPTASWYSANILNTAFAKINKTGLTQFRLRFAKDDNDDGLADYLKFYSGNAPAASRPQLIIQYYVP